MFIALEGIDGSGTTTQAQKISQALEARGFRVHRTAQPSAGQLGKLARQMLGEHDTQLPHRAHTLALTFAGDRLDHYDRDIAPALSQGKVVICDRYLLSSWVYQSLDLPFPWVQAINQFAPWPDLTLLLDLDADKAHARVKARQGAEEIYDRLELQRTLAQSYRQMADMPQAKGVERINADAGIEDLCETLLQRILAHPASQQHPR